MIINSSGITKEDREKYVENILKIFAKNNQDLTNHNSSPQKNLVDILLQFKFDIDDNQIALAQQLSRRATGEFLDLQAGYLNLQRKSASNTILPLKVVANNAGTLYNNNDDKQTQFIITINGNDFTPEDIYRINEPGEYIINFVAIESGEINVTPQDELTVKTPLSFIDNVYNLYYPISIGTNGELDSSLRDRMDNNKYSNSTAMPESVESQVKALTGVIDATWFQNTSNTTDTLGLPPRTFYLIVEGGETNAIGEVLYVNVGNNSTFGEVSYTKDGRTVYFDRNGIIPIYATFELKMFDGSSIDDIKTELAEKIAELANTNKVFKISQFTTSNVVLQLATQAIAVLGLQGAVFDCKIGSDAEHIDKDIVDNNTMKYKFTLPANNIIINNYE